MATIRLDKFLADMQLGTRSEVKQLIRKGRVMVDNIRIMSPDYKFDDSLTVYVDNQPVKYTTFAYYMLNKPQGVLSAARDKKQPTVLDLITDKKRKDLFPVGRLDKDTEGLLLITNDGELSHELLAPKKHVDKVYYATVNGRADNDTVKAFAEGVYIEDDVKTLPAQLEIISSDTTSEVKLTIHEGKFHQVKRMFQSQGMEVTFLKRLSMGPLKLDENLQPGEYRELTDDELRLLLEYKKG